MPIRCGTLSPCPAEVEHTWVLKARLLSVNSRLLNLLRVSQQFLCDAGVRGAIVVFLFLLMGLFLGGVFLEVVAIRSAARVGDVEAYSTFHANLDISLALVFIVVVCSQTAPAGSFLYRLRNFKGYDHRLMEHVAELEEKLVVVENSGPSSVIKPQARRPAGRACPSFRTRTAT